MEPEDASLEKDIPVGDLMLEIIPCVECTHTRPSRAEYLRCEPPTFMKNVVALKAVSFRFMLQLLSRDVQGFVGSKGYCRKFKSLRLWDETWGLCNMPRTPLISSLISCLNSSSSRLANSWHSSITHSSQTTIRFPPRPDDCLSWFCWIKMSKLLRPTLWAGAATYKTCSAHHSLTSLAHAHLHVCVHAVHVCIIHQHTCKFKTSFKTYMHTYTCTCPRPCTWNKYHISFLNQIL